VVGSCSNHIEGLSSKCRDVCSVPSNLSKRRRLLNGGKRATVSPSVAARSRISTVQYRIPYFNDTAQVPAAQWIAPDPHLTGRGLCDCPWWITEVLYETRNYVEARHPDGFDCLARPIFWAQRTWVAKTPEWQGSRDRVPPRSSAGSEVRHENDLSASAHGNTLRGLPETARHPMNPEPGSPDGHAGAGQPG